LLFVLGKLRYWDGTDFSQFNGNDGADFEVRALSICGIDENLLWVGGAFSSLFGQPTGLAGLLNVSNPQAIVVLQTFNGYGGDYVESFVCVPTTFELYAGGDFSSLGSVSVNNTAKIVLENVCLSTEVKCVDGSCKPNLVACFPNAPQVCSNSSHPFWCPVLTQCVSNPNTCRLAASSCQPNEFLCWDGSCALSTFECPLMPSCPALTRRCNGKTK